MKYVKKQTLLFALISLIIFLVSSKLLLMALDNNVTLFYAGGDIVNQHITFLDNMRINFQETRELFPQLNMNLAMMSSFANYFYHWTYNIWTYVSFLYSGTTLSFMCLILSASYSIFFFGTAKLLTYYTKSTKNIIVTSLLLTASGSFLGCFTIHIIFILGLPFVPYVLWGVHRIMVEKKSSLFIISFVLIIFSSFSNVLAVGFTSLIYVFIVNYKMYNKKYNFKKLFVTLIRNYFIIILLSAIIIVPLMIRSMDMARSFDIKENIPLIELLINKDFAVDITFQWYVIGASSIGFISLFYHLFNRKTVYTWISFMIGIIFLVPSISLLFNFMQYSASKAFIPLLPFFAILFLGVLESDKRRKNQFIMLLTLLVIILIPNIHKTTQMFRPYYSIALMITTVILILLIVLFNNSRRTFPFFLLVFSYIVSNAALYIYITPTSLYEKSSLSENSKDKLIIENANKLLNYNYGNFNQIKSMYGFSTTVYSSINTPNYKEFYTKILPVEQNYDLNRVKYNKNIIYDIILGIGNSEHGEKAYPIMRGSYDNYTDSSFNNLPYLERPTAFLRGNITPDGTKKFNNVLNIKTIDDFVMNVKDNGNDPSSASTIYKGINLDIPQKTKGVLLINFDVSNVGCDTEVAITINGHANRKHSCDRKYYNDNNDFSYMIDFKANTKLNVKATVGDYSIKDFKYAFIRDEDVLAMTYNYEKPSNVKIDLNDSLEADFDMKKDGYLISSIPYDKGFILNVDNKNVVIERVNKNFIGTSLTKGKHHVKLSYKIPGFELAQKLTVFGFVLLIFVFINDNKPRKKIKSQENDNIEIIE